VGQAGPSTAAGPPCHGRAGRCSCQCRVRRSRLEHAHVDSARSPASRAAAARAHSFRGHAAAVGREPSRARPRTAAPGRSPPVRREAILVVPADRLRTYTCSEPFAGAPGAMLFGRIGNEGHDVAVVAQGLPSGGRWRSRVRRPPVGRGRPAPRCRRQSRAGTLFCRAGPARNFDLDRKLTLFPSLLIGGLSESRFCFAHPRPSWARMVRAASRCRPDVDVPKNAASVSRRPVGPSSGTPPACRAADHRLLPGGGVLLGAVRAVGAGSRDVRPVVMSRTCTSHV